MARVRRFVVYACSFGLNGSMTPYVKFNKHNFCWPHAVAEHYNLHLSNRSRPGTNIDTQFQDILNDVQESNIRSNDIVLVQWTHTDRYFSEKDGTIFPTSKGKNVEWLFTDIYNEQQAANKLVGDMTALDVLGINVYHSFADGYNHIKDNINSSLHKTFKNFKYVGFNDVGLFWHFDKKDKLVHDCCHPNDKGHKFIADQYIKSIKPYV